MASFGSEIAELDVHELKEYLVTHMSEEVEQESVGVIETHKVSGKRLGFERNVSTNWGEKGSEGFAGKS